MNPLFDIHTHTISSGHAYSTLEENVRQASFKGLRLIGIADHAPAMPGSAHEIYFNNFRAIPRYLDGVEIMMGAELNILNSHGEVDLPQRILKKLDFAIASLHHLCMTPGSKKENTKAILAAMENPYISIIGHPGDPKYPIDVEELVLASQKTNTLLEMNEASLSPLGIRAGSSVVMEEILDCCQKKEIPVVMGTDAHFSNKVGNFTCLMNLIEKKKFPLELVLNFNPDLFQKQLKRKKETF